MKDLIREIPDSYKNNNFFLKSYDLMDIILVTEKHFKSQK